MKLINILKDIDYELVNGFIDTDIKNIETDSRKVEKDYLFIPIKGFNNDGNNYIKEALDNGAICIITEKNIDIKGICIIKVANTKRVLGKICMNFYNNPQDKLIKIGITGTKGKTTTSFMIKKILEESNNPCGVIGTNGVYINDIYIETNNTTPEEQDIIKYMSMMVDAKIKYLVMEVSSQALKYGRVKDIIFDYAIFTNLTKDHIGENEHVSMKDYINSKSILFNNSINGIFNIDDDHYNDMTKSKNIKINTFGKNKKANLIIDKIDLIKNKNIGINLTTKGIINDTFEINLPGQFSAYNAAAAILTCYLLKIDVSYMKEALKKIYIKGRVEQVKVSDKFSLLIDYAHNKISTESILTTIKEYNPKRIVTIFGCGGNRSKDRRYEMGKIASKYSDFCIITEDNNRCELFADIANDILKYFDNKCPHVIIPKRKEAIKYAIKNGMPGDIIMLLGKGHETYIEKNNQKIPFDERKIIEEILKEN